MENYWTIETPAINYTPTHNTVGDFNYALFNQEDAQYTVTESCMDYEVNWTL